jgi:raffinose/stachyose/melibiose transport system permease protein
MAGQVTAARRGASGPPGAPRRIAYLYVAPGFIAFVAFLLIPILGTLGLSFTKWNGIGAIRWAGLANYAAIVSDPGMQEALLHAIVMVAFYSALPIVVGLLLAAALTRRRVRGLTFFRVVLFLPYVISGVVVAVIWRAVYDPDGGILNIFLQSVGLGVLAHPWLGDSLTVLPALGFAGTWVESGLCLVLFLAGIQNISPELYDAARVDGAGPIREFFAVTLPGVRMELAVAIVITVIAAFRNFDLVYNTTSGGPGTSSVLPTLVVYQKAFLSGQVGTAAALAITITAIVFLVAAVARRLAEQEG